MFVGGNFWDGRATGERLGSPSAEQALGPFLNPLEQALNSPADVIGRICVSTYSALFLQVCGADACNPANTNAAYDCVGYSVAAYEASPEVNQFSSKYDAVMARKARFTEQEKEGFNLFLGKAKCNRCHSVNPRSEKALFTDYTFDNLGVPKNPKNPFYTQPPEFNPLGAAWIDPGLGGFLNAQMMHPEWVSLARENFGKHKVPTLRNVDRWDAAVLGDKVKAYSHNGYFKSLKGIVHFYNTRDVLRVCPGEYTEAQALAANCWPLPELALNMNTKELGDLGLTDEEEDAIVAFMKTLSDGFFVP
jgi:cytochrome c peroxidase